MIRTITIGNHISVQGLMVATLEDGRVAVLVDQKTWIGTPVSKH